MMDLFGSMKLAVVGFAAASLVVCPLQAAEQKEYKPKVASKTLFEGALDGLAGKKVIIKQFTLPAGYKGGKHMHTGHVFVYVLEGEIAFNLKGLPTKNLKAGELYREVVGQVMWGQNLSSTKAAKIVVFQIGDADKPMMIKVK